MPRLSIDITAEEHQRLKAVAALKGQSIKDFVLSRTLETDAMQALADFLDSRIAESEGEEAIEIATGGLSAYIQERAKIRHDQA